MSKLFTPITIGDITLKNRIVMSPMCQYSAEEGFANDWHFVHYVSRAVGGAGTIIQEATAVIPEGRITYGDLGIWDERHIDKFRKITDAIKGYGTIPGIQLAHAGRKGSCDLPWNGGEELITGDHAWPVDAPSAIPFENNEPDPVALPKTEIDAVTNAFQQAALRAVKAGYQIIEIHAAHGYLIHQFLSPLSNQRTDEYGGSFENRIRLALEVVDAVGQVIPKSVNLWVRISATDWVEGGWNLQESVALTKILKEKGVHVIDVSSGGLMPDAIIPADPGYQSGFAETIKRETGMITGSVGLLTEAVQMETLLTMQVCDLIVLGRKLLADPYFPIHASRILDRKNIAPKQYGRA